MQLCIIDTPDFSDSYNQTLSHILSYLSNLTPLKAICIVIDSTDPKLKDYEKPLRELLRNLGSQAQEKLLFFFTKCLSIHVSNEQRKEQAQSLLQSLSLDKIKVQPEQILRFDSTFILHPLDKHSYDPHDQKFEDSWLISKKTTDILMNYLLQNKDTYVKPQRLKAFSDVQSEVHVLVRPITEAIRNILRNMILQEKGATSQWIDFNAKPIERSSAMCIKCGYSIKRYGKFWIILYSLHGNNYQCQSCQCNSREHIPVDYQLDYDLVNTPGYNYEKLRLWLDDLVKASRILSRFLQRNSRQSEDDLFLNSFNRLVKEESDLSSGQYQAPFNHELHERLVQVKNEYRLSMEASKVTGISEDAKATEAWIPYVKKIPFVGKQVQAIRDVTEMSF